MIECERISLHGTLKAAVERADIVFEAAPENLELKQDIFAQLSASTREDCIRRAIPSHSDWGNRSQNREFWPHPRYSLVESSLPDSVGRSHSSPSYRSNPYRELHRFVAAPEKLPSMLNAMFRLCRQPLAARSLERSHLDCGSRNLRCRNGRSRDQKQFRNAVASLRSAGECRSCRTGLDSRDPQRNSSPS